MAADTLDVLAIGEAEKAINVPSGSHTTELEQAITAVSRRIDEVCGPVVIRAVTEYHDGGESVIVPRETPVSDVTTLKEWDGSTLTTLTEDAFGSAGNTNGYWIRRDGADSHGVEILRRSSGNAARFVTGEVELVYDAGRYANTASVDRRFKQAVASILRRLWDREAGRGHGRTTRSTSRRQVAAAGSSTRLTTSSRKCWPTRCGHPRLPDD